MDEINMGKIFCKNYSALIFCLIFTLLIFIDISNTDAAFQEDELFEKAYNYYLSYQPGKAIDFFDIFLQEYPESSSRDAALFWKARSLVQTNKKDEAVNIFRGIIEKFPTSHFRGFAEAELDNIKGADMSGAVTRPAVSNREITISQDSLSDNNKTKIKKVPVDDIKEKTQLDEYKNKLQLSEKAVLKADEDKNICIESLKGEKKKVEDLSQKTKSLFNTMKENQRLKEELRLKEEQKQIEDQKHKEDLKLIKDCKIFKASLNECDIKMKTYFEENRKNEKTLTEVSKERDDFAEKLKSSEKIEKELKDILLSLNRKQESQEDTTRIETKINKDKTELQNTIRNLQEEVSALSARIKQLDIPILKIGGKQYTAVQVIDEYLTASDVENKLKQKTISWKKRNAYEDFLMEQLLLNKAQELKIKEDTAQYNMLIKQYSFSQKEKSYLSKYLIIDKLISKYSGNIYIQEPDIRKYYDKNKYEFLVSPGEKVINVLSVDYSAENELERNLLMIEIQNKAANGYSLKNIHEKQPDLISLKQYGFSLSPDWIKEEAKKLKEGEISNIISKDKQYIIIQTWKSIPVYEKYENVRPVIRGKLLEKSRSDDQALNKWLKEIKNADGQTFCPPNTNIALHSVKKTDKPNNKSVSLKKKKKATKTQKTPLRKKH